MAFSMKKPSMVKQGKDIVIYGDPKTGKTTILGIDSSVRVLLLSLERGEDVLADAENVDVIDIDTWEDVMEIGKGLRQGFLVIDGEKFPIQTWDIVALDSLTRLEDLCKDYVVRVLAPNRRREVKGKFGAQSDWGNLREELLGLVKGIHVVTKKEEDSINFVWIAHKAFDKDDTGRTLGTKLMLQGGSTAEVIMSYVDAVLYSFKWEDEKTGVVKYGVSTKQKGIINADVRIPRTREQLPNTIVDPKLGEIIERMNGIIPSRQKVMENNS